MPDTGTTSPQPPDPRLKYVDAAIPLFAGTGFHGTSIARIAQSLGLTKQAMLHHFGSKDALYAAALGQVAERYRNLLDDDAILTRPPAERLEAAMELLARNLFRHPDETRLLVRELMENGIRTERTGVRHLRPFLNALTEMAQSAPHWRGESERTARAGVYLLLGALNYLAISGPALANIYGEDVPSDMERRFLQEIRRLIASPRL